MTQKEKINRNIGLTFDYVNYLIDNKEEVEKLHKNFELEFIEKDFSKMESKEEESLNSSMLNKKYVVVKNSFDVAI